MTNAWLAGPPSRAEAAWLVGQLVVLLTASPLRECSASVMAGRPTRKGTGASSSASYLAGSTGTSVPT